ncbi:MAG: alpha-glucan family phosphorylase, partial [Fimbriimonas sp.]
TWVSKRMTQLYDQYLGDAWKRNPQDPEAWERVAEIPDEELWSVLESQRSDLVRFVRKRLVRDLGRRNVGRTDLEMINGVLDPRVLTIGFARRFATYKRATLMLNDSARLMQILNHPERPVQIVIAGKSHPRDDGGKTLIQHLVKFINEGGGRARMVFLEDYDMQVARQLVQGVDLWLNNPRRPHEASGTSGMKVVPNGGLNCSILDGWWDEGYAPGVGWAIGDRSEQGDEGHQDWLDSRSLYDLLEHEITPVFYHRVERGIPQGWLNMVRRSIMQHAPYFSTSRMVSDYARKYYVPAARAYQSLTADHCLRARQALDWRSRVRENWGRVGFVSLTDTAGTQNRVGGKFVLTAKVHLGNLAPSEVKVEALVGRIGSNRELVETRPIELQSVGLTDGVHTFEATIACDLPGHLGYVARISPSHPDVHVPSELGLVSWSS